MFFIYGCFFFSVLFGDDDVYNFYYDGGDYGVWYFYYDNGGDGYY